MVHFFWWKNIVKNVSFCKKTQIEPEKRDLEKTKNQPCKAGNLS